MEMIRPIHRCAAGIFIAVSFALLSHAAPAGNAIPPVEKLLPSDTLFLVTAPDFAALRTNIHQSPQWLLWNDPAMKPLHDKFMAKWNEKFVAPLERDLGVKLSDFTGLPQGQLTFAVTQNGWNGGDDPAPGVLLLLDAKGKSDLLKTNLAALRRKWTDAGKSMHTETIRGIAFSVVPLSSNDVPSSLAGIFKRPPVQELGKEPKPEKPGELVFGQYQSLLIAGSSVKIIEPVAALLTGGAQPPLGDNAIFAADRLAQFRDAPLYYGWFNAKALFNVLVRIPQPEPNPEAPSPVPQVPWDKVLSASGLTGLKSAGFAGRESRDGSQVNIFLSVPETTRQGIFKMISTLPKDANPPAFVTADTVKFLRWRVDGRKAWNTLETMLGEISPAMLSSLNSMLDIANANAQKTDPSFDVRKNLIANLGDDFINYQKAPVGTTLDALNNAPSLFLFTASNPDQAVLAVKNIAFLVNSQQKVPEPREFLGRKIHSIPLAPRRVPGAAASVPRSLYCVAGGGYVALTTDVSMIEEYLRNTGGKTKPLRETAGLVDAAQHVRGAGNGLFAYENQRESMRPIFAALKKEAAERLQSGGTSGLNSVPLDSPGNIFREWMDFSLLPDYDKVSKYFSFSVSSGGMTADGFSFQVFAPRPPQMGK